MEGKYNMTDSQNIIIGPQGGNMSGQNQLVSICNLTKKYNQKPALSNLNLSFGPGHIIGLLGPNGSGKTTLLKILAGVCNDYEGTVTINGMPIGAQTKAMVSYLPDTSYFSPWMTPLDMMNLFQDFYFDFDEAKCEDMMGRLRLNPKQKIKQMSKGTIEKFQLSLVMSRKAKLYLLDEPIGGVDPAARDFILDTILNHYNEEGTILLSTHLISDVERIFDTIIFLKDSEIVLQGDIDSIREEEGKSIDHLFREVFKC